MALGSPMVKYDIVALNPATLLQLIDEYLPVLSNFGQRKLSKDRQASHPLLCRGQQREGDKARAEKTY